MLNLPAQVFWSSLPNRSQIPGGHAKIVAWPISENGALLPTGSILLGSVVAVMCVQEDRVLPVASGDNIRNQVQYLFAR